MKNYFIAAQIKENEKFYAYVIKVSEIDNLISKLKIKNIVTANVCESKKEAERMVNHWNACFKVNSKYMFDLPLF